MITLLATSIYFAYNQFLVYDSSARLEAGLAWTEAHSNQGFVRRPSSVAFGTLAHFGDAELAVHLEAHPDTKCYDRIIAVPIHLPTGKVIVEGPEEFGNRYVLLEPGHYCLILAQWIVQYARDQYEENSIAVDLFFQRQEAPLSSSKILVADEGLELAGSLLETTEVADMPALVRITYHTR